MLIIAYDVVTRGIFNIPNVWAFDLALYFCGTAWIVGGAYVQLYNRHVRIDLISSRFPPRIQCLIDLIVTMPIIMVFCGVLVWIGGIRAVQSMLVNETLVSGWDPIIWPIRFMIPLGGLLMILQTLAKSVRDVNVIVKGRNR